MELLEEGAQEKFFQKDKLTLNGKSLATSYQFEHYN